MSKMIRVSEDFHELIAAHRRDGETMEDTLRRLVGGPDPEILRDIIARGDDEAAADLRRAIERRREAGRERRRVLRERFQ